MRHVMGVMVLAAAVAVPSAALAAVGEFAFVTGQVTVAKANGQRVTPVKGTTLDQGDTIVTGRDGMVQLVMADEARISLRPNTQFLLERYGERRDSTTGPVLNLVKGTLRTFTGLVQAAVRDKYVFKTRVATVGIRGSGNILHACEGAECDPAIAGQGNEPATVNHTIEGSHAVTAGGETVVTGPGQTVLVQGNRPPRSIQTPAFISNAAITMTGTSRLAEGVAGTVAPARVFAPSDVVLLPRALQVPAFSLGSNGLGFSIEDTPGSFGADLLGLQDVVIAAGGSPYLSQTVSPTFTGNQLTGFAAYEGLQSGVNAVFAGGALRDAASVALASGESVVIGRIESVTSFGLLGSAGPLPGSVHWAIGPSGSPPYLSDVLTGSATYTLAAATAPTNQDNTAGTLGTASLNVNFNARTLNLGLAVTLPAVGSNAGGQWQLNAANVPFAANSFYASTGGFLTITRGSVSSQGNGALTGSVEGSFVGRGLSGAIVGYGIQDRTSPSSAGWNSISGIAVFAGPVQNTSAPYREGRFSAGNPAGVIRSDATTARPDEIAADAQGRLTSFTGPFGPLGSRATYALGSAQVVQSGIDPETGLIWGRWGGGTATVTAGGQAQSLDLRTSSLHYIFAGTQTGPVSLPLTGTGIYDVIGSTSPTDGAGHVGTFNSAALSVNFTTRRLDATVNIGINGQTWIGNANGVPIYRDQYFSAYAGTASPGLPNPGRLVITCTPSCGSNATGSLDGFFAGRSAQRAGMLYNLGGNQGAVAFGRRGG